MEHTFENNTLIFFPEGRIDGDNAENFSAQVEKISGQCTADEIVFDLSKINYVSSAGLRIFLRFAKIFKDKMKIREVTPAVYDIFEMTAMTKILDVQRAFRKISVDGLAKLGRGTSGIVYRLDKENILKVYRENWTLEDVQKEREKSQDAFLKGLSTAISYDVVKCGESFGIVYEMIDAKTLEQTILDDPENMEEYSRRFAEFVKEQHRIEIDAPSFKQHRISQAEKVKIYSAEERDFVRRALEAVPECKNFSHGDLNLCNVLLKDGQFVMIDMGEIGSGHPIFDVSWIYFFYHLREKHNLVDTGPKKFSGAIWKFFAQTYFNTKDEKIIEHYERELEPYALITLLNATLKVNVPQDDRDFGKKTLLSYIGRKIEPIDF